MGRSLSPLERATAVLGKQFGAISHAQAVSAGLTEQQIRTLCQKGHWYRPVRGVLVAAGSPDTPQQRAMISWLATRSGDGVLSFVTGAWTHELLPASPLPYVTVRPGASPRSPVAKICRSLVPLEDRVWRFGMTVTTPSRTVVDLAAVLERPRLEAVVDAAACRRLLTADSVQRCVSRMGRGHRGAEVALDVVAAWSPFIEADSPAEMRLLRQLRDLGLTGLVTQYSVEGPNGFVARLDLAVPELRRGFEYDGAEAHTPRRWGRDELRYAELRALGWEIHEVTKADLLPGETRLRRLVERWLAQPAA